MTRVLLTGGTGVLGRALTPKLQRAGYTVRVMSRKSRPSTLGSGPEWAQADLETGRELAESVKGADVILHAATRPFRRTQQVDVDGTRRLVEQARSAPASVAHFLYVSIVGIDRIPFPYYRHKLAAEAIVAASGLPWSILRATQFHTLLDGFLQPLANLPISFVPTDFKFQPVDPGEVADRLCALAAQKPAGLLPDMGGPEVLALGELAQIWLAARRRRCRLIRLPLPGKAAAAFRNGYNTCPDHRDGKITWAEWVKRKYSSNGQE